jgi:hypothetical protein
MGFGIRPLRNTSEVFERMKFGFSDDPRVPVENLLFNAVVYDRLSLMVGMSVKEGFSVIR